MRHLKSIVLFCTLLQTSIVDSQSLTDISIAKYKDNKQAAISYTFDDGLLEHYSLLREQLRAHRFLATFAVIGNEVGRDHKGTPLMTWAQLRELAADGHEMSNHGWAHKNVTKLSAEELRYELLHNDTVMHDSIGVWPRTFIYPGNRFSNETIPICEQGRVGSRTKLASLGGKRTDTELRQWVDSLIHQGQWAVMMTHGISYGYDHFPDPNVLWRHFDHVDSLRQQIWIGTFADVSTYTKEREATSLTYNQMKDGTIEVIPSLSLDSTLYNMPLTLVINTNKSLKAKQGGKILKVTSDDQKQLIDFIPSEGKITITQQADPAWDDTKSKYWDACFQEVSIESTADGSLQKAYLYKSNRKGQPLIVSLHTWSGDYKQSDPLAKDVVDHDWNYIHPDFRGPNLRYEAMGSKLVIQDIEDAIRWAVKETYANPAEVHVVGVSGGGFATLATYMQGKYPVKSFSAWAPISDIRAWYWESRGRGQKYADHIAQAIGKGDGIDEQEAIKRSPLHQHYPKKLRKNARLYIYEGVHDGYRGSVPITHSLLMYNRIAKELKQPQISQGEILDIVVKQLRPEANPCDTILGRRIWLKHKAKNVSITIFEGRHEQLDGALTLIPVNK